jgi:hypothetical protein
MLYKPGYHPSDLVGVLVQQLTNVHEGGQVKGLIIRHEPGPSIDSELGLPRVRPPEVLLVVTNCPIQYRSEELVPTLRSIIE